MAEDLGDQDKAKQIQDQLNELEERAEALDRQRTKNISAIRYVNRFWLGLQTLPQLSGRPVALYTLCCTGSIWGQGSMGHSLLSQPTDSSLLLTPQLHQPAEPRVEHCRVREGPCGE